MNFFKYIFISFNIHFASVSRSETRDNTRSLILANHSSFSYSGRQKVKQVTSTKDMSRKNIDVKDICKFLNSQRDSI